MADRARPQPPCGGRTPATTGPVRPARRQEGRAPAAPSHSLSLALSFLPRPAIAEPSSLAAIAAPSIDSSQPQLLHHHPTSSRNQCHPFNRGKAAFRFVISAIATGAPPRSRLTVARMLHYISCLPIFQSVDALGHYCLARSYGRCYHTVMQERTTAPAMPASSSSPRPAAPRSPHP